MLQSKCFKVSAYCRTLKCICNSLVKLYYTSLLDARLERVSHALKLKTSPSILETVNTVEFRRLGRCFIDSATVEADRADLCHLHLSGHGSAQNLRNIGPTYGILQ